MELALGEGWLSFDEKGQEIWKSEDHKSLVHLCDGFCYAEMAPYQIEEQKVQIQELCEKIGYPPKRACNGSHVE